MAIKKLTQTETAERLRISTSWLRTLTDRGEIRRNEDGTYPWPGAATDYDAYQDSLHESGSGNPETDFREARARKTMAEAEMKEDEQRVRRGELIQVDEVLDRVRRPLEEVDAALRAAPRKHSRRLSEMSGLTRAQAVAFLGELIEEIRADLRRVFGDDVDGG